MIRFLKNQPTLSLSLQSLSTLCLFTYRAIWFCVHKQLHYCLSLISSSSSFRTHFLFCLGLCCKKNLSIDLLDLICFWSVLCECEYMQSSTFSSLPLFPLTKKIMIGDDRIVLYQLCISLHPQMRPSLPPLSWYLFIQLE